MPLRIQLLGGVSVLRDDRPIDLPTRKAAGLLALLASRPGATWPRERVAALLWSRSAEAQARGSLRQALAQLRRALAADGEAAIEASGDSLRLAPDSALVDVAEVEAAFAAGTRDRLKAAVELYGGTFLDGLTLNEEPFEEWRRAEAARLHGQALQNFGRLLGQHADAGEIDAGVELGERLLRLDPTDEEIHRTLIRLHLDRGAFSAAMRQYERCRVILRSELGVVPSVETETLRRRMTMRPMSSAKGAPASEAPGAPPTPSVAVLPFTNLSDDPHQTYLAHGFAEDVVRELSRFRGLTVISRHSSFALGDLGLPPADIGERLGAQYLLSGSVRKTPATLRIGTELIDAEAGRQVWSHRYDIDPDALFEVLDEIVRGVAGVLATRIDDEALRHARRKPDTGLHAYDWWLRGVACLRQGTFDSHAQARALFQRALDVDPHFARAYAGLSLSHFNEWSCLAWDRWDENEARAFEFARQAVDLDDADNVTQFILGRILLYRREFERAERHLDRAEELNPNDADILAHMALARAYLGQPERGIETARTATRLNPLHDEWYYAFAATPYFVARRLEEALPLGIRAPDVATDARAYLAAASAHLGRQDEARRHLAGFLEAFRRNITPGHATAPGEAAQWLLRVNPYRRDADADYLLEGVARAGLPVLPAGR